MILNNNNNNNKYKIYNVNIIKIKHIHKITLYEKMKKI